MQDFKIILIESVEEDKAEFSALAKKNNWECEVFSNCFEAFQFLKDNAESYCLIFVSEPTFPLDTVKIQDYLHQLGGLRFTYVVNYSETIHKEEYLASTKFIKKPFLQAKDDIKQLVQEIEQLKNNESTAAPTVNPVYDLDYLNDISDGDQVFVEQSLISFRDFVGKRIQDLLTWRENLNEEHINKIKETAHQLKPSFQMLNNETGSTLANELCYEVSAENKEEISAYVMKLKVQYDLIMEQIKKNHPKL